MPEITIYTNDGDCANGVAEINPFTVGDATDDWTLKFNDGNDFYSPSNVTMRVGHTNGLPDGTYNNAFKWIDRTGAESLASINLANGVPALTFNTDPVGGVVGTDGVYILRGPQLDGAITSIDILEAGQIIDAPSSQDLWVDGSLNQFLNNQPSGTSYASAYATSEITDPNIVALIGNATWFDQDGVLSGITRNKISFTDAISFSGDFSMSFKKIKLFHPGAQNCIASGKDPNSNAGTFIFSNGAGQYEIKFYSDLTDIQAIVRTVTLNLNNWFLIQENTEYDYTIERSGLTWTLSVSLNGSIIASGTGTGIAATNLPFYISSIGQPVQQPIAGGTGFNTALYGILKELKFFDSSNTLIHYYGGNGGGAQDWIDLIGNNNALTNGTTFIGQTYSGSITSAVVRTGGSGFTAPPIVVYPDPSNSFPVFPLFKANGNWAEYEFPFMRDESGNDIIAGTALSPYSDGKITDVTQYDHSTLVIRPETVDNASLTQSGLDWVGTMNPVNAYVNSRLSLRNSTQLDIQIRGDDRTLFQGQLTILNKIN
jgi:hypothetical protein